MGDDEVFDVLGLGRSVVGVLGMVLVKLRQQCHVIALLGINWCRLLKTQCCFYALKP